MATDYDTWMAREDDDGDAHGACFARGVFGWVALGILECALLGGPWVDDRGHFLEFALLGGLWVDGPGSRLRLGENLVSEVGEICFRQKAK